MQAVGPAPVLTHHSSKQEPLNFSRFGDVLNKVSGGALVSIVLVICQLSYGSCKLYCWISLRPLKCYIIKLHSLYGDICILGRTIFTGTIKQKYFKLNLKIFWYFTKTFLCYGIFFLYFYIGFGILQRFYIETSSAQRENYFMMSSFGNSVISFNVFGTSWKYISSRAKLQLQFYIGNFGPSLWKCK